MKSLVYGVKCSTTPYRHKWRELRLHIFLTLSLHKWVYGFRFLSLHPKGTSVRCLLVRGCVDPRACQERLMSACIWSFYLLNCLRTCSKVKFSFSSNLNAHRHNIWTVHSFIHFPKTSFAHSIWPLSGRKQNYAMEGGVSFTISRMQYINLLLFPIMQ